ncbi:MAG: phosphate acyltransferase PlsX [Clostridiales bacterium]|nr:phosphate acyltransferase PlsX [Clostridiales bacterium]
MKIIVDIGACDHPAKMVNGAVDAANEYKNYTIVVVGDEEFIKSSISGEKPSNLLIEHAPDVIENNDTPTKAIRQKPNSSLVRAIDILNNDPESVGLVSGGSTGAVLTGATLLVGRIKGVHRPVLASLIPSSIDGKLVCVADCGANVDSKPEFLLQFAKMADIYVRALFGTEKPVVGLLSVGTEDHKGDERSKATHALLKETDLNFVGNMEARDALTGNYDVIVTDGFAGNVLIKSIEGTAKMVMSELKKAMYSSVKSKIGALLLKKSLYAMKDKMNYHAYGGAAFLGVKKPVIKTHGSSNEVSTKASIRNIIRMHEHHIIDDITAGVAAEQAQQTGGEQQ